MFLAAWDLLFLSNDKPILFVHTMLPVFRSAGISFDLQHLSIPCKNCRTRELAHDIFLDQYVF
jgi:hypothetical protein